jgi:hypothetical protein
MTSFGMVMMFASYTLVVGLAGYCFYRVMKAPGSARHEHAPLEIDTRDSDPEQ